MFDLAKLRWLSVAFLTVGLVAGCVTETAKPKKKPIVKTTGAQTVDPQTDSSVSISDAVGAAADPCADRLHALCGPLLLYYHVHRKLPENLEKLREIAGPDPDIEFSCPVSHKPYIYNPRGLPRGAGGRSIVGGKGFLVIYDAEPAHRGQRWAIYAEEPKHTAQPLVAHVVSEPEKTFQATSQPQPPTPAK